MQARAMKACFQIAECSLFSAKIRQNVETAKCFAIFLLIMQTLQGLQTLQYLQSSSLLASTTLPCPYTTKKIKDCPKNTHFRSWYRLGTEKVRRRYGVGIEKVLA